MAASASGRLVTSGRDHSFRPPIGLASQSPFFYAGQNAMASHGFPESDWRTFRELQPIALERFCQRTLEEVQTLLRDPSPTHRERYRSVFQLLRKRDHEIASAFDDPRRSRMVVQLVAIHAHGLREPEELGRFSDDTRPRVESLAAVQESRGS